MHYYCTLFDSSYLTRGIAMLESLQKHSQDYHLYILAFDDIAYKILNDLNYPHTTIISMQDFEDDPNKSTEAILEAILQAWLDER